MSSQNAFSAYLLCLSLGQICLSSWNSFHISLNTLWREQIAQQGSKMGLPIFQHLKTIVSLTLFSFVGACYGRLNLVPVYSTMAGNRIPLWYAGQNSLRRKQCRKRLPEIYTKVPFESFLILRCACIGKNSMQLGKKRDQETINWMVPRTQESHEVPTHQSCNPHRSFIRDPRMVRPYR